MRKRTLSLIGLGSILIVASLTLIVIRAQNSSKDASTEGPVTVEGERYPLKLTITLSKTELRLGEDLVISLTLENIGKETLTFSFSDGYDDFDYLIYNETDVRVYSLGEDHAHPQIRVEVQMAPGDKRNETHSWDQRDGFVYNGGECYYNMVPPGRYRIRGNFNSLSLGDSRLGFNVETPYLTFTILR